MPVHGEQGGIGQAGEAATLRCVSPEAQHAAERAIGNVLSLVLLLAVVVQLVRGESASPYAQLLLLAGVVWVVALVLARRRGT